MSNTAGEQDDGLLTPEKSVRKSLVRKSRPHPKPDNTSREGPPQDATTTGDKRGQTTHDRGRRPSPHCKVQPFTENDNNRFSAPQNGDSKPYRVRRTEKIVNEARDAEIDLPVTLPRLVSKRIRQLAFEFYPILEEHNGHRAFFLYVMNTPKRDDEDHWGSGRPLIDMRTIARCYGPEAQDFGSNLQGFRVLQMYQKQVVPGFEWTDYHSPNSWQDSGNARTVDENGVHPLLEWAWKQDRRSINRNQLQLVDFYTGNKHNGKGRYLLRKEHKSACRAAEEEVGPACEASREWRDYLHKRPSRLFQSVTARLPEAREKARGYDGQRQVQAFLHLSQIQAQPKPFYRFTEKTVRIQAINQGLQQIDSDLRDILTRNWTKLDLSSAQLGIAAREWGVESALDLLNNGESIWESLTDHMRVPMEAKPALKRGLYATIYGASRSAIPYIIAKEAGKERIEMSDEQRDRFFTHIVIEELLSRREEQFKRIKSQGGDRDCYENWIDLDGREKESILSQLAQAREMWLLSPALELAKEELEEKTKPWQITLYLHDGFCVNLPQVPEYHLNRIKRKIGERAEDQGYPTGLEVEE